MASLGIYEKALPKDITWFERLNLAKNLGFDFVEMSIDETDSRLSRLDWSFEERKLLSDAIQETGIQIQSICLSGHRRYPLGSAEEDTRNQALSIMEKTIQLAVDLGVRNIQLAGYDVYYEEKTKHTNRYFIENLKKCVKMAASKQVMLSIETMDDPYINSISKFMEIKKEIQSPWLQVYPDIGNLSAWPENNIVQELELGIDSIVAVHLKDTESVTEDYAGKFKEVAWGEGNVDFLYALKTLKRLDYDGSFLLEMWSETKSEPIKEIEKAKAFILPLLIKAGY